MTMTLDREVAEAATEKVTAIFDDLYGIVGAWHEKVSDFLKSTREITARELDPLVESFAVPAVQSEGLITGAGFVAAPYICRDAAWHLAWWLAAPNGGSRRLATVADPESDQFRDYTTLEWWRIPAQTRTQHLTGPYVDYLCTEDYAITMTIPIVERDELCGMVGVDILIDRIEKKLLPSLRAFGKNVAIVNSSARVVTSTDSTLEPGSLLRISGLAETLAPLHDSPEYQVEQKLADGTTVKSCGKTALSVVIWD